MCPIALCTLTADSRPAREASPGMPGPPWHCPNTQTPCRGKARVAASTWWQEVLLGRLQTAAGLNSDSITYYLCACSPRLLTLAQGWGEVGVAGWLPAQASPPLPGCRPVKGPGLAAPPPAGCRAGRVGTPCRCWVETAERARAPGRAGARPSTLLWDTGGPLHPPWRGQRSGPCAGGLLRLHFFKQRESRPDSSFT